MVDSFDDLDDGIAFRLDRVVEHGTVLHGNGGDLLELFQVVGDAGILQIQRHFGHMGQLLVEAAYFLYSRQSRLSAHPCVDEPEVADHGGEFAAGLVGARRDQVLKRIMVRPAGDLGEDIQAGRTQKASALTDNLRKRNPHGQGDIRISIHPGLKIVGHDLR